MTNEREITDLNQFDWSRTLVIGGLMCLDTQEVYSNLSHVDRVATFNGKEWERRIKVILHTCSKGVSIRAQMWAQNEGRKHAPFQVGGRQADPQGGVERVFTVGKPTVALLFPGLSLVGKQLLGHCRRRQIPIVHIDEFYPKITLQEARLQGIRVIKDRPAGRDVWKSGTLDEVLAIRNAPPPDNSFLQNERQIKKFLRAERALFGKK